MVADLIAENRSKSNFGMNFSIVFQQIVEEHARIGFGLKHELTFLLGVEAT
jgi:hypothetical protein